MNTMKIKVILGHDIRLWRYSNSECTLSSLREFVSSPSSFGLSSFWLQWEDDEGDRITLQEEHDFKGAIACAQEEDRKSLKIYVHHGSHRSAQGMESTTNLNDSVPSPKNSKNASSPKSDSEFDRCAEMRGFVMDFVQNPEIMGLLPDLHRRFLEEIQKCKVTAESQGSDDQNRQNTDLKWDSPQNLERILRSLLESEAKFAPITAHPLYQQKLKGMIPMLCTKMSGHLPMLMGFSTDVVAQWIPHLASVLGHGFSSFDGSAMSSFFPLMSSFFPLMNGSGIKRCSFNKEVIHHGVRCDGCNMSPIKGDRFKCTIRSNFDLCSQCESKRVDDANCPMIKFKLPMSMMREISLPSDGSHGMNELMRFFGELQIQRDQTWRRMQRHQNVQNGTLLGARGPPPGMGLQGHPQWWNKDGDHHYGPRGPRGWRRWNRWPSHHEPQRPSHHDFQHHHRSNVHPQHQNHPNQQSHHHQQSQGVRIPPQQWKEAVHPNGASLAIPQRKYKVVAEFVTDVNLPDRTYYPTDTVLTKTWKMRNSGEYEWGTNVELVFFKGNETLTLEKRYPVNNAQPGDEVEVSAVIKTPTKPGRYCSYYRLQRNGEFFGPRVWVDIFAVDEDGKSNGPRYGDKVPVPVGGGNGDNNGNQMKSNQSQFGRKYKRKEAKLNAKQQRIASKMDAVSKELEAESEAMNPTSKLVKIQDKLQRKQERIQQKMDRLRAKSMSSEVGQPAPAPVAQQPGPVPAVQPAAASAVEANVNELQLLDDIANAAVQDVNAVEDGSGFHCVCGSKLHKTTPLEAYRSLTIRVECDVCGQLCPSNSSIYHCPQKGNNGAHPGGYDVCAQCLDFQMQRFIGQQPMPRNPNPNQQMNSNVDPVQYPKLNQNDLKLLVAVPPAAAQQPAAAQPQHVVPAPVLPDNGNNAEEAVAPFMYQEQLNQLKAMGFAEDERIKQELMEQKGNVQRVANRLLQQ